MRRGLWPSVGRFLPKLGGSPQEPPSFPGRHPVAPGSPTKTGVPLSVGQAALLKGDPWQIHCLRHVITHAAKAIELGADTQQHHRSPDGEATQYP